MRAGGLGAGLVVAGIAGFDPDRAGAASTHGKKHHTGKKTKKTKKAAKKPPAPTVSQVTLPSGVSVPVADWVVAENKNVGTLDWVVTYPKMIYGYVDTVSATPGQEVTFYVDSPGVPFHVEAYRMGYYGGLGGRLMSTTADLPSQLQPPFTTDPVTNMIECAWTPTLTYTIPQDWPSGYYLFKFVTDQPGIANGYVELIVRDDTSTAAYMIMNSCTTAQAYNTWGGRSLYVGLAGSGPSRSRVVSFDRPYDGKEWGAPNFIGNEFPLVFMAESLGLDVTYSTDIDLHAAPALLLQHKTLFSLGHDEYWSQIMRTAATNALAAGVNLAFLGANAIYRHIRLEPSPLGPNRHQICYKTDLMTEDPYWGVNQAEVTSDWPTGPMPRPEQAVIGIQYTDLGAKAGMTVVNPSHWIFAGTGVTANQVLPNMIVGEYDFYDGSVPGPANVEILAHSPITNRGAGRYSDMSYYSQPGGGGVFASGNAYFIYRLSNAPDIYPNVIAPAIPGVTPVLWRMMENLFSVFGAGPATLTNPSTANWQQFYGAGAPATVGSGIAAA